MSRRIIMAIVWKELRAVNWVSVGGGSLFGLFWAIVGAIMAGGGLPGRMLPQAYTTNAFIGYIPLILMLYLGNSLIVPTFYQEKVRRTIEPLLCTPLQVRDMWLGKVLAVHLIASAVLIITAGVYLLTVVILWGTAALPDEAALVQFLLASPLLAFAVFGLMGYIFLALLNPALVFYANLLVSMGALSAAYYTLKWLTVSWLSIAALLVTALVLLRVVFHLVRRLDKERIVLTIPG